MKLPRDTEARELIKALQRIGYHVVRHLAAIFACKPSSLSRMR